MLEEFLDAGGELSFTDLRRLDTQTKNDYIERIFEEERKANEYIK